VITKLHTLHKTTRQMALLSPTKQISGNWYQTDIVR